MAWLTLASGLVAQDAARTGLEGLAWQSPETLHETERALIQAFREPFLAGRDCHAALQSWLDGRAADARGDKTVANAAWEAGVAALRDLAPLPPPSWPDLRTPRLKLLPALSAQLYLVQAFVMTYTTDAGRQYGLLMLPASRPAGHRFPLLVYVHGGDDGLTTADVEWAGEHCRRGYVVVAPALRGQPLAGPELASLAGSRCEGDGDGGAGESTDVLAAARGALTMPLVRPDGLALVGLGHGGHAALLAATRSPLPKAVAVVEAWQPNPFRYYWARMARGENLWPEWATFCNREPAEQLDYLRRRSVAHQAEHIPAPVLMLLPEASAGSLDEEAHRDVADRLRQAGREATLEIVPGAPRGLTARSAESAGPAVMRTLSRFLYRHWPPDDGKDALFAPAPTPLPSPRDPGAP